MKLLPRHMRYVTLHRHYIELNFLITEHNLSLISTSFAWVLSNTKHFTVFLQQYYIVGADFLIVTMDDLDALLIDLQNSVPGKHQYFTSGVKSVEDQKHDREEYYCASGYGILNEGSVSHSDHYVTVDAKVSPLSNLCNRNYKKGNKFQPVPSKCTDSGTTCNGLASFQNKSYPQIHKNTNLSELDSLLQDLSSVRYNFESKKDFAVPLPSNRNHNYNTSNTVVERRPAVNILLNEMDETSMYPAQNVTDKSPTPGRHVTITVRETKTEKFEEFQDSGSIVQENEMRASRSTTKDVYASSATKELDDLMASLSNIKVNSGSHHHQTVTDYAKPNKGISHLTKNITETSNFIENSTVDHLDSMLGSLQANMSRQGVSTMQKGCCNACEKPIVGQVITALGKTWHPEHFTCNHCNQELGTRNFFERDGYPYCEPDYHNLFSPRCAYCSGAILDKCVTALEKTWHTEHFFCAQCGQQFGEDGFHEREGKPYCRNDYFEMFAPKCNGCNRAIMENYISALNSQWHPDCFVCRDCRQPFQGGSFYDHEGRPYCELHYHTKRGSLCSGCSKPITGRCITAMLKKFHPEHFVCAFCLKQLNKGTFKEQNEKPYCHICFEKIFG